MDISKRKHQLNNSESDKFAGRAFYVIGIKLTNYHDVHVRRQVLTATAKVFLQNVKTG